MTRLALVLALLAWVVACKKKPSNVIAKLEQMTAQVERMPREAAPWQGAHVGDTFVLGSAVRTGAASTAKLRVGKSGKLDVSPNAVVYFTRTPGRERNDLRVEAGTVELEAGEEAVGIGEAVLEPGGKATLESSLEGTTLTVRVGRAVIEDNVIEEGERVTIGTAGKAVAEARPDAAVARREAEIRATVKDKAVMATSSAGERELAVGDHQVEADTALTTQAGGALELEGAAGRVQTTGASKLRVGDTSYDLGDGRFALGAAPDAAIATIPGGSVTVTAGTAWLEIAGKIATVDAISGDVTFETAKGKQTITRGQSATLAASGDVKVFPAPPASTVVTVAAGESPSIHDARAPTAVRVTFDDCKGNAVLEVAKDRAFKATFARTSGTRSAAVLVPAGAFSYRVRCDDGTVTAGTLRVDRESGRAPLPKTAARTAVEMDGREYTILYQNLLPQVTLAWRNAPPKPSYTFVIKPAKGAEKRINNPGATLKLPAGDLSEGSYTTWVEAVLGARSEQSRIVIEFDNAAPSASIAAEVRDKAIHVKGTVIDGSTVSGGGTTIALDRHLRFESDLVAGDGEAGIGVRIAHPKAGIHYYVMRR